MGKSAAWTRLVVPALVCLVAAPGAASGTTGRSGQPPAGWIRVKEKPHAGQRKSQRHRTTSAFGWRLVRTTGIGGPKDAREGTNGKGTKGKPAAAPSRWFAGSSPINTPIPSNAEVDQESAAMVTALRADAGRYRWAIGAKRFTPTVWYADASTPRYDVPLSSPWSSVRMMYGVPIPAGAKPDESSDGHMTVIDRSSGCFYEFFVAARTASGGWQSRWANRGLMSGSGIQAGGYSTRDTGFANHAGLIRPEELHAGVIDHALTFSTTFTRPKGVVLPATAGGGTYTGPLPPGATTLPEGARVQLDPRLDLDSLPLSSWQKTIARALQVYGMYLVDSGSLGLYAVNANSFPSNPYSSFWGDSNYAYLPTSLVSHLRVVKLGSQYDANALAYIAPSPCATMR